MAGSDIIFSDCVLVLYFVVIYFGKQCESQARTSAAERFVLLSASLVLFMSLVDNLGGAILNILIRKYPDCVLVFSKARQQRP